MFFIDYLSLFQYRRGHSNEEESFRCSMQDMHLLYANSGASFCYQVWSITSLTPHWWKLTQCQRRRVIPAYSKAVDAVQAFPLAVLKPRMADVARHVVKDARTCMPTALPIRNGGGAVGIPRPHRHFQCSLETVVALVATSYRCHYGMANSRSFVVDCRGIFGDSSLQHAVAW